MNRININIQARYFDNGADSDKANEIWFVLHGYGQLAEYFIRHFEPLKSRKIRVIAPEGLHRYYLEGTNGRVGASWMTKEDRLTDIENYLNFLNEVYVKEVGKSGFDKVVLLGFSQGAATVTRWASDNKIKFDKLILWAGLFPPDLNFALTSSILEHKSVYFVYGTKDHYLNDSRLLEMQELSDKLSVDPTIIKFEGGHTLSGEVLERIAEE